MNCYICGEKADYRDALDLCEECFWENHPRCDTCGETITTGFENRDGTYFCGPACIPEGEENDCHETEWEDWME
jgi:hypothetical protein